MEFHRVFGVLIMLVGLYLAAPRLRGLLLIPLIHVAAFAILMVILEFFGCKRTASEVAKRFFNGFRIGGHRGSPLVAPENTMESFEEARLSTMDLVEFDLALTSDGIAVLMHDDDLMRTCGVEGNIASFSLLELSKHDAGFSFYKDLEHKMVCRIPTLKQAVEFCKMHNLKMLFDVKDGSMKMVSQIVDVIKKDNLYEDVIVSSFFPWVSYAIKKADPNILTGITWRPYFFSYSDLENEKPRFTGLKHYFAVLLDLINVKLLYTVLPKFLGVEMMLTFEKEISGGLVRKMQKQGIQVVAWTVNNKAQMLYCLETLKIPFLTDAPRSYKELEDVRKVIAASQSS